MGAAIISTMESAFGLISSIAENLLTGFTKLFWVAPVGETAGHLTVVAEYAFVMLGVSVVFSVIRLCFQLLRGNTGI